MSMKSEGWLQRRSAASDENELFELFHENSKMGRYDRPIDMDRVKERMKVLWTSHPFDGFPSVALPEPAPLTMSVADAIVARSSARSMTARTVPLDAVSALLRYAYGVTRDERDQGYVQPFRAVPSAGGLYPLELYVHAARVEGVEPGIYHYHPNDNVLREVIRGDQTRAVAAAFVQEEVAYDASIQIFVTAVFERTTFKYGARGYRFAMLEAGHVGQNLALVATALGLQALTLGGYRDRALDEMLAVDGTCESTVYAVAVGGPPKEAK